MTDFDFHAPPAFRSTMLLDDRDDGDGLTVPYTGQTRMRLTITSGLADARVRIDPDAVDLITIDSGEGIPARLRVSASEVRVSWPPGTIASWLRAAFAGAYHDIDIVLHPAVEWTLLVRGGLSRFEADLAAGKLARFEISGGVSEACLDLPAPSGAVPVRISGGVSVLDLRRPADAGVDLAVNGGISGLRLDDQAFAAIGGAARLATGGVRGEAARYAVEISGGASDLEIVSR
jgi:hypothetical protein